MSSARGGKPVDEDPAGRNVSLCSAIFDAVIHVLVAWARTQKSHLAHHVRVVSHFEKAGATGRGTPRPVLRVTPKAQVCEYADLWHPADLLN
jgi:hypothetical protein